MKGIILAGGTGTRLFPVTYAQSKQMVPIYDKPMIYYPLSTLLSVNIKEILIITTPETQNDFKKLLGDGSQLGCKFEYAIQPIPQGLAQAFVIGESFIGNSEVCLILGDNIFYGTDFDKIVTECSKPNGGIIFGYHVQDPERYGIIEIDKFGKVISIEEKPKIPKSNFAVPGIYFYDNSVIEIAKSIKPSSRGEYEITDVNRELLRQNKLKALVLDRGTAWLDTGTFKSLLDASNFVHVIEERQGLKIGCIEEIAFKKGYINEEKLIKLAEKMGKSGYGDYLMSLLK